MDIESPHEPMILLTRQEIWIIIQNFPHGITVSQLVKEYEFVMKKDFPFHGHSSHQLLLEAMPDIVKFDGPLVLPASNPTDEEKADGILISRVWIEDVLKILLSPHPKGMSLDDLKILFLNEYFMDLPLLDYPNHRLMLESFSHLLVIRDERNKSVGLNPDNTNVRENDIVKQWTRHALMFMLSPMKNGITLEDLRTDFSNIFGVPLPTLEFPTDRTMIKSFSDILEVRGDKVYAIKKYDPEIQGERDEDVEIDQDEPKAKRFKMASQFELNSHQAYSVSYDEAKPEEEALVMTTDVDESKPEDKPLVINSCTELN